MEQGYHGLPYMSIPLEIFPWVFLGHHPCYSLPLGVVADESDKAVSGCAPIYSMPNAILWYSTGCYCRLRRKERYKCRLGSCVYYLGILFIVEQLAKLYLLYVWDSGVMPPV